MRLKMVVYGMHNKLHWLRGRLWESKKKHRCHQYGRCVSISGSHREQLRRESKSKLKERLESKSNTHYHQPPFQLKFSNSAAVGLSADLKCLCALIDLATNTAATFPLSVMAEIQLGVQDVLKAWFRRRYTISQNFCGQLFKSQWTFSALVMVRG